MTIKTEGKKKVKCSLECRIHSYRQSLKKFTVNATNLIQSKLCLTKHLFKHNAKHSGIIDFQMVNEIRREAEYMNKLKIEVQHLKVKQAKKQLKKLEKKKLTIMEAAYL